MPALQIGQFSWELPKDLGDYWVTSQAPKDCQNGVRLAGRLRHACLCWCQHL